MISIKLTMYILTMLAFANCFAQDDDTKLQIIQLDQKNAEVVAKGDTLALMKLLAPQFTINRTTGTITSGRDETLALMRQGLVNYSSFLVTTEKVLVKSDQLAISMGNEVVVSGGNRQLKGQQIRRRFTHVWIKADNRWMLLARHASNLCSP